MTDTPKTEPQLADLSQGRRSRLPEMIVEEIRRFIAANNLEAGYRLPPERALMEQLNVGRSSLREAIRILSTLGLVDVRHGDGTYIARPAATWETDSKAFFDATEENALRNFVEARLGIEFAACTAATQRGTEEDFDRLEEMLNEQDRRLKDGLNWRWEPLAFELAVVEASGNTLLHELEEQLKDIWRSLSQELRVKFGVDRYREWHSEHRAILASMRSRNLLQVQRMVVAHVSLERFEQQIQRNDEPDADRTEV